ncbi:MAG: hypothetical protein NVS2B17_16950 [Candidatus Velthaea sp.]
MQSDPRASSAVLVEITLDPEYDTPRVLERYGRLHGADPARWHLLTGDSQGVLEFAREFGVWERHDENRILHTERTVIVDSSGRIERFIDDPSWTANDLALMLTGKESVWLHLARASGRTVAWCGGAIAAHGRLAVHHFAVIMLPIAFLAGLVFIVRVFRSRPATRVRPRS